VLAAARKLPPEVWALGAVSLLTDAASDMIYPLLPQLLTAVGGGALALGIVEGTAELTASFVKAWAGRAADRGGKHGRYVIGGYALASLARPCLAFITAPWQAVVARSVDRFGKGLRSAPRDAIISKVTPKEHRGLAFGVHRSMDNAGAVVGPLLATMLLALHVPLRRVIMFAIVPGIFSTLLAVWAVRKHDDDPPPASAIDKGEPIPVSARSFLLAIAFYALAASADSFLLLQLGKLGLGVAWIPIAWLSLQLLKSLFNAPGGALADRYGPRTLLIWSWLLYAISYVAFAFAPTWPIFWGLFALYAVHYGLGEGAEKSFMTRLVPEGARGTAFGLQHAVHGLALLPANVVFGFLYMKRPAIAFGTSAGLAVIAVVVLVSSRQPDDGVLEHK
jgi:MFS family permease